MLENVVEQTFLGNQVVDYIVSLVLFLVGVVGIKIFEHVILVRMKKLATKTKTTIDDYLIRVIHKILVPLACFGALYLTVNMLTLEPGIKSIIDIIGTAVLALSVARFVISLVDYAFKSYCKRRGLNQTFEKSLDGILKLTKFIIWGTAIVFLLDNLGFKITAVITGLGIGGIAVALAAQAVLGDLFSYFAILFDRPFEIGDFIIIGDYLGCVEHIGIKTTRISSLGGEQLIFANTDLTNSRIRNYKRMKRRRVVFKVGITYNTPLEQVKEASTMLESIVKSVENATFDRAHFLSYGDFSLIYEIVFYVESPEYNVYMDIQQQINFLIKEQFAAKGIEFAYPTQTLYINKEELVS